MQLKTQPILGMMVPVMRNISFVAIKVKIFQYQHHKCFSLFSHKTVTFPYMVCEYVFVELSRPESEEDQGEDEDSDLC